MTELPVFETQRLRLRPLTAADANDLFALYRDAEAMRYMPDLPHSTPVETAGLITHHLLGDAHNWAITRRDDPTVLGYLGYLAHTRIPGMGYALRRDCWGQGIMVEAARPILDYGFDRLGFDRLELWIDERNGRSRRVADKLGFRQKGRLHLRYNFESEHHVMAVYGLRAGEWRGEGEAVTHARTPRCEIVLGVHNIAATTAYYRDKLGFHIDFIWRGTHAGVSRGDWSSDGVVLQFSQLPADQPLIGATYLYIHTDHRLDELHAQYAAAGVEILSPPANHPWGMREFAIRDLNGYQLRFGTVGVAH